MIDLVLGFHKANKSPILEKSPNDLSTSPLR
jgi:hypothetical protein